MKCHLGRCFDIHIFRRMKGPFICRSRHIGKNIVALVIDTYQQAIGTFLVFAIINIRRNVGVPVKPSSYGVYDTQIFQCLVQSLPVLTSL